MLQFFAICMGKVEIEGVWTGSIFSAFHPRGQKVIVQIITGGASTFKGEQAKIKVWVQKPSIPPKNTLTVTLNEIDPI